jgi:hypothetical protein
VTAPKLFENSCTANDVPTCPYRTSATTPPPHSPPPAQTRSHNRHRTAPPHTASTPPAPPAGVMHGTDAHSCEVVERMIKPLPPRNSFRICPTEPIRVFGALQEMSRVGVARVTESAHANALELTVHGDVDEGAVTMWCEARLASYRQPTTVRRVQRQFNDQLALAIRFRRARQRNRRRAH